MSSEDIYPLVLPLFANSVHPCWNWMKLSQIADVIDCPHSTPELTADPYEPFIARSQDIRTGTFLINQAARVSEATYKERISRAEPQFGDILYSREGTYFGIAAEVPPKIKVCLGQRMVLIKPNQQIVDYRFLKYWLNSPQVTGHINGFRDGSVAERLNLPAIRGLAVALPSLIEQKEIAGILAFLDYRIQLLRKTNATLEAIAQALFKSWFVDFDPVHAKAEGRAPEGMDADTAALFPDSFEESRLRMIPKGWHVCPIGDAINIAGGGTPNTKRPEYWSPEEYAWTSPKDLSGASSPVMLHTEKRISAAGLATISSGLLPSETLLLSSRAPIGYLAIAQTPIAINQGYIAFLPNSALSPLFMYFWCKHYMETIKAHANGSTFMEISKKAFRLIPSIIPPQAIVEEFVTTVRVLFERLTENERQALILITIRNALLPRLISGKLRLRDVV